MGHPVTDPASKHSHVKNIVHKVKIINFFVSIYYLIHFKNYSKFFR